MGENPKQKGEYFKYLPVIGQIANSAQFQILTNEEINKTANETEDPNPQSHSYILIEIYLAKASVPN
jgi:hypothetical protein